MGNKVILEIFGVANQSMPAACSCGGDSSHDSSQQTMLEAYDDLVSFIKESEVSNNVEIKFIDLEKESVNNYENIEDALNKGYTFPLTVVNGRVRFHGNLSNIMIYRAIKRSI